MNEIDTVLATVDRALAFIDAGVDDEGAHAAVLAAEVRRLRRLYLRLSVDHQQACLAVDILNRRTDGARPCTAASLRWWLSWDGRGQGRTEGAALGERLVEAGLLAEDAGKVLMLTAAGDALLAEHSAPRSP